MLDDIDHHVASPRLTDEIRQVMDGPVSPSVARVAPAAPDEAQAPPVRQHSQRWYVVRHEPFQARDARSDIRRAGFEAHWPRRIIVRPRRDEVVEALFPGYLFARFDRDAERWGDILASNRVVGIIGMEWCGQPIPVPMGEIEALIARAGGIDIPIDCTGEGLGAPLRRFRTGESVSILDGMFAGRDGRIVQDKGADRVTLLLKLLGGEREVQVARSAVG